MVDLLSGKILGRTGELASGLPTASEDAVESDKKCDAKKSAAGKTTPSVAVSVSVVPIRAEVRAIEAVRVPERPEDTTEDQRDCDEDEDGWNNDKGEHCVFSI
jgi:hypothetical protein